MFKLATIRKVFNPPRSIRVAWISGAILGLACVALALAFVANDFQSLRGWVSFAQVLLLGGGILGAGWWLMRSEMPPRWLGFLIIAAALLRLAAGAVWFVALPSMGHGNPAEKDGYVMADAQTRDQSAWRLAQSDNPLTYAFTKQSFRKDDQYGSLLLISAAIYRYLGGDTHQPLQMVAITAAFSSLAILFTWAFARRAWGRKPAWLAAWILALFPEAVLLGSSQMREAFVITFAAVAFYGLVRFSQERSGISLAWIMVPLLLNLPLSPPLTALLMAMLFLTALSLGRKLLGERALRDPRFWFIAGGVVILVLAGLWLAGRQFAPQGDFNPVESVSWWLRKSAEWQAYLSRRASGWIQKIFRSTPEWTHVPLLVSYGVFQPFLPAALIASSEAPIWHWMAIWRAVGWIVLLPALLYAPLRALTKKTASRFTIGLALVAWLAILAASYRAGGDEWDNSRYRVAFASLLAGLVAWVWMEQIRGQDAGFRRTLVGVGLFLAWFLPWYLQRYLHIPWPVGDIFKTLGLGIASLVLFVLWDWARTDLKRDT